VEIGTKIVPTGIKLDPWLPLTAPVMCDNDACLLDVTVGSPPKLTVLNGMGVAQPVSARHAAKVSSHFIDPPCFDGLES
jgi:predicted acyltransferase (DUF342 family)